MPVEEVIELPAATVKSLYESNPDTNAFTDAEKAKLTGIEAGATADQSGTEIVSSIDTELGQSDWQLPGGSSFVYYEFYATPGDPLTDVVAFVYASGPGVTFAKDTNTGVHEFGIPDGVLISGGGFQTPGSFADPDNDLFLQLNYAGVRQFNETVMDAIRPSVELHNGKSLVSRGNPSFKSETVQTALTAVGSGSIEVLIADAGTTFAELLILFYLPL